MTVFPTFKVHDGVPLKHTTFITITCLFHDYDTGLHTMGITSENLLHILLYNFQNGDFNKD